MKTIPINTQTQNLIPVLTDKEKEDIRSYFAVYEKYKEVYQQMAMKDLASHPVFGILISSIPADVLAAQSKLSDDLQRNAILMDDWIPYIEHQITQGIAYAKMGFAFKVWYEVVTLVRNYLTPDLFKEYGKSTMFISAINGMNTFFDIAMGIIGEAYMQEKNLIIEQVNEGLEKKVSERTLQLETVNKELEAFSYSVSHDLRAPLRAINGYAEILNEDYGSVIDQEGKRIIDSVKYYAAKMGRLIDELLTFSRLGRKEIEKVRVDMGSLIEGVISEINKSLTHKAKIKIGKLPDVYADYGLLNQVMFNLISNAIKYSSKKTNPVVEIISEEKTDEVVFHIKDNGVGFDMRYSDKLFDVFQRLHSEDEFEGTGVGLAIVQRIITRHGGKAWAYSEVNKGATFSFILTKNKDNGA